MSSSGTESPVITTGRYKIDEEGFQTALTKAEMKQMRRFDDSSDQEFSDGNSTSPSSSLPFIPRAKFHRLRFPESTNLRDMATWKVRYAKSYQQKIITSPLQQWWTKHIYVSRRDDDLITQLLEGKVGGISFQDDDEPVTQRQEKYREYLCKGFPVQEDLQLLYKYMESNHVHRLYRLKYQGKYTTRVKIIWKSMEMSPPSNFELEEIPGCMLTLVEVTPTLPKCYNCQDIGHIAKHCKNRPACPTCGGQHSLRTCTVHRPAELSTNPYIAPIPPLPSDTAAIKCIYCQQIGTNAWHCPCTRRGPSQEGVVGGVERGSTEVPARVAGSHHTAQDTTPSVASVADRRGSQISTNELMDRLNTIEQKLSQVILHQKDPIVDTNERPRPVNTLTMDIRVTNLEKKIEQLLHLMTSMQIAPSVSSLQENEGALGVEAEAGDNDVGEGTNALTTGEASVVGGALENLAASSPTATHISQDKHQDQLTRPESPSHEWPLPQASQHGRSVPHTSSSPHTKHATGRPRRAHNRGRK